MFHPVETQAGGQCKAALTETDFVINIKTNPVAIDFRRISLVGVEIGAGRKCTRIRQSAIIAPGGVLFRSASRKVETKRYIVIKLSGLEFLLQGADEAEAVFVVVIKSADVADDGCRAVAVISCFPGLFLPV